MISSSLGHRAQFFFVLREARRSNLMIASDRSILSCRAIFFLSILIGLPCAARSATIEDSAKELARHIAGALPAGESVSFEMRNISSLRPDGVSRVEQALKSELQDRGIRWAESGGGATRVIVTLSENWKEFVWTSEIRQGEVLRTTLLALARTGDNHFVSNAMHVTVRSEKFWEGREHILDATQVSGIGGDMWIVLLLADKLVVQESGGKLEIPFPPAATRDLWGKLGPERDGHAISFSVASRECSVDLDLRSLAECLPTGSAADAPLASRSLVLVDLAPAGPPPPGNGIELVIAPVCGGTDQFLATSARDYTQTDSLQVFQAEPNGPAAISGELDFPGPILALHAAVEAPRAIVQNLSTGNYEAYRVAISCGQ
jgi:hypothetical protein